MMLFFIIVFISSIFLFIGFSIFVENLQLQILYGFIMLLTFIGLCTAVINKNILLIINQ